MTPIGTELDDFVLRTIQAAYLAGKIRKTKDCLEDMARAGLLEADVENVILMPTRLRRPCLQQARGRAVVATPIM